MDPVAALLNEHPPQLLSVTELHSNIALLEDAVRACSAELESRPTTLESMPDEMQQLVFGQLRNVLDPRDAVDFSSASKGLRELMQRIGEGASKSLLQQLQEEYAAVARALRLKARPGICCPQGGSCKAVREAKMIHWIDKGDLAMLGKLIPLLPALESLSLKRPVESSDSASPDSGQRLVEGLGVGALPAVTELALFTVYMGDAGASALAASLDRGALPRLEILYLLNAAIGDTGLVALAPALRRRPALKKLDLACNPLLGLNGNTFGDEGLAALVAPPPADAPPPQAEVLAQLKELDLGGSQITDDGCTHLASRLRGGALPALCELILDNIPASKAAIDAVYEARPDLLSPPRG